MRALPLLALVVGGIAACHSAWESTSNTPGAVTPVYGDQVMNTPPPAISGGTLLVLRDNSAAIASDPDRDRVWIVDLVTQQLRGEVVLNDGDEPGRVVETQPGTVFVALRRGGGVAAIDTSGAGHVIARYPVCTAPRGIDYDPSNGVVHVACTDGTLASLRASDGAVVRTLQLDDDLRDVVVLPSGLVVTRFRSAEVLTIASDGTVMSRQRPMTPSFGIGPQPEVAYRTVRSAALNGLVMVHQLAQSGEIDVSQPQAPGMPAGAAIGAPGSSGGGAYGASGTFVSCGQEGPAIVQSAVTTFNDTTSEAMPLSGAVLPVDIAVSQHSSREVVVAAGNASLGGVPQIIELDTCQAPILERGQPSAPQLPQPNGQVTAAAFDGNDHLIAQTREPPAIYLIDQQVVIALPGASRSDTGHEIFYSNTGGNIACASCHAEGGDDGHIWNFSDVGLRRTMNLRGVAIGDGPFHWGGELPHFSDIVTQIFETRMSGPNLGDAQIAALQHFVHAIPAPIPPAIADSASVARGQALFQGSAGCSGCHNGARMTNDQVVDVGTGGRFKVPSLVGIASHAPYLHDGCAATLRDRFGPCGGGDQHGATSQLSDAQIGDLVTYLQTL